MDKLYVELTEPDRVMDQYARGYVQDYMYNPDREEQHAGSSLVAIVAFEDGTIYDIPIYKLKAIL